MEYFDLTASFKTMVDVWHEHAEYFEGYMSYLKPNTLDYQPAKPSGRHTRKAIDPSFLSVRPSICVTGLKWTDLQRVKSTITSLNLDPIPLESLHVKRPTDVKDGALLVPKVVLVGNHIPGKRLIDDDGDEGQLDYIYDEICEMGADVFVVYFGLPRSIYKPMRHMVYHPRMIDVVFPNQPILRKLAENNLLVTLVEGQDDFTLMQKNVMREWLEKPVGDSHAVYQAADYLSSMELDTYGDFSQAPVLPHVSFYSESEVMRRNPTQFAINSQDADAEGGYIIKPAEEHHPLADRKKKKDKKKLLSRLRRKKEPAYQKFPEYNLMDFAEEEVIGVSQDHSIEMNLYGRSGNPVETISQMSI